MASFAFRSAALLSSRCTQTAARLVTTPLVQQQPQRAFRTSVITMVSPKEAVANPAEDEIVFNPLKEGKAELQQVEAANLTSRKQEDSLARINYASESEAAINQQIAHELTFSHMYLQMASFFNRDNVALPGFASFFRVSSLEERTHAQQLMDFQAQRGGRVKLTALIAPESDFMHEEKGDALHAMEVALALEKLNFQMLMDLHEVADRQNDAQMSDFVEDMMSEQAEGVKVVADYVATLKRIGKGLPVFEFDRSTMVAAADAMRTEVFAAL